MINTFHSNKQLLEALSKFKVEFIIIGGVAVHFHNSARNFDDLDILINPTISNANKLKAVLTEIGLNVQHKAEDIAKPKVQIPLKNIHYADIVTPNEEVQFEEYLSRANRGVINGVKVMIASINDLIAMKSTDRPRDIKDIILLTEAMLNNYY